MIVNCKYTIRIFNGMEYFVGSSTKYSCNIITDSHITRNSLKLYMTCSVNVLISQHQYG